MAVEPRQWHFQELSIPSGEYLYNAIGFALACTQDPQHYPEHGIPVESWENYTPEWLDEHLKSVRVMPAKTWLYNSPTMPLFGIGESGVYVRKMGRLNRGFVPIHTIEPVPYVTRGLNEGEREVLLPNRHCYVHPSRLVKPAPTILDAVREMTTIRSQWM